LNPLLVKELRGRMRGPRAFLFLTGVLVLLGLVSYGLFQLAVPRYFDRFGGGFNNAAAGSMIGQTMFVGLVFLTLLLVCAIAPSLTAGAISGEHQRKTFDLLMATPLTPFTILAGKLGAALSYVVLILLAAVPMTSLAYVFGGVTISDLLRAFAVMGGFAIVFSVMGLFFSALFQRTGLAVGTSYFLLGAATLGTMFVYAVMGVMRGEQPPNWVLALNPFSTLASALVDGVVTDPNTIYNGSSITPMLYGLGGGRFDGQPIRDVPLWQYSAAIYTWLTLLLFAVTTQLIKPVQRFQLKWWMWVILALLLAGLIVGVIAVLRPSTFNFLTNAYRYWATQEHNVVVNGRFAEALAMGWTVHAGHVENSNALPPPGMARSKDGRMALRVSNPQGGPFREQKVTQELGVALSGVSMVNVAMVVRLSEHETPVCGERKLGGTQCPVTLRLDYTDRNGKAHNRTQGFFTTQGKGFTARCRKCEGSPLHLQIPADMWFAYDSGDLFESVSEEQMPARLDRVSILTNGQGYRVEVAEVTVRVHEGRPLGYGKDPTPNYGWSWQSIVPYWVWEVLNGQRFPRGPGGVPVRRPPVLVPKEAPVQFAPGFGGMPPTPAPPPPQAIP
jgi:ABC-type transport system involved in multi-copper enzyme maturation permease subunit